MRIGIVYPAPFDPAKSSISWSLFADGFRKLGHEVCFYSEPIEGVVYPFPIECVSDSREFNRPEFWARQNLDVIVVMWLAHAKIFQAARKSGAIVICKADTDGNLGIRRYPFHVLERMYLGQDTLDRK